MAVSIQLLRSSTASKRPTAANLAAGELGLNFNDSTSGLFYENASGNVMKVGPVEVSSAAPTHRQRVAVRQATHLVSFGTTQEIRH